MQPQHDFAELDRQLAEASAAYHAGEPTMPDLLWDNMKRRLAAAWPEAPSLRKVGAPPPADTPPLRKRKHRCAMGSLANAFTAADIRQWLERVARLCEEAGVTPPTAYVLEPKHDGASVELIYRDGVFHRAITRGDGVEGEDCTHNMRKAKGLPMTASTAVAGAWMAVRGEVVVHRDDMKFFPGARNPRNTAAGTIRRLDSEGAQHLRFYAFDAIDQDGAPLAATESKTISLLEATGFTTAPTDTVSAGEDVAEEIIRRWTAFEEGRKAHPYDCDGLVIKVANRRKCLAIGEVDGCPRGMLAMKYANSMQAETVLRGVDLSVGRSGVITPVGVFDPVDCGGVTVTRASLCNFDEVARLDLRIGARVLIGRAGEVIPKAIRVISFDETMPVIQRPDKCPKCGCETVEDGPRQVCPSMECPARTYRAILHYVQQRVIDFLGEDALDRLMAVGGPVQTIADLYRVSDADLERACGGAAMARKVRASILKSVDCPLDSLFSSVGIPGLGMSESRKLIRGIGLKDVESCLEVFGNQPQLVEGVPGFGQVSAAKIQRGVLLRIDQIRDLAAQLRITAEVAAGPLSGKSVCATGASERPRDELMKLAVAAGADWKTSVVNGLSYLIMADPDSTSTKAVAARKKGVQCISEKQFLLIVGFNDAV